MTDTRELLLLAYSAAGRLVVEWLAESLRRSGVRAVTLGDIHGNADETETLFRHTDGVVAIVTSDDLESPAVFFDLGAAAGMDKPFVILAPSDVAESGRVPAALRPNMTVFRGSADKTASEIVERAFPPAA